MLAGAERAKRLAERLPAVLRGDDQPGDVNDQIGFAELCYGKKLHAAAARLFAQALSTDPALAADRRSQHPYNAACAAALAGCGKGEDNPAPDEAARLKLRQQALDWLKAEHAEWSKLMEGDSKVSKEVAQTLRHWQVDPDLAGVREPAGLMKLSEEERARWRALWDDVGRLLREAESR